MQLREENEEMPRVLMWAWRPSAPPGILNEGLPAVWRLCRGGSGATLGAAKILSQLKPEGVEVRRVLGLLCLRAAVPLKVPFPILFWCLPLELRMHPACLRWGPQGGPQGGSSWLASEVIKRP